MSRSSTGGTTINLDVDLTTVTLTPPGSAAAPMLNLGTSSGLYARTAGVFDATANSTQVMEWASGGITSYVPQIFPSGTAGAPSIQLGGSTTGPYSSASNQYDISANATHVANYSATGATFYQPVIIPAGTVSAVGMQCGGVGTGPYSSGANVMDIGAGGVQVCEFASTGTTFQKPVVLSAGTVSAPALVINSGSSQTGISSATLGQIDFPIAGVAGLSINSSKCTTTAVRVNNNTVTAAAVQVGAVNNGVYASANNNVDITANGTRAMNWQATQIVPLVPIRSTAQPYVIIPGADVTQSIPDNTITTIGSSVFGSATTVGTDVTYSAGVVTFAVAGTYLMTVTLEWVSANANRREIGFITGGGSSVAVQGCGTVSSQLTRQSCTAIYIAAAADTMNVNCYQQSGGAVNIQCHASYHWSVLRVY